MPTQDGKAIVRRYLEEVNNGGNIALADELIADDFRAFPRGPSGREGLMRFCAWQRATAPDWHITIEDMIAEGDRVAVWTASRQLEPEDRAGRSRGMGGSAPASVRNLATHDCTDTGGLPRIRPRGRDLGPSREAGLRHVADGETGDSADGGDVN